MITCNALLDSLSDQDQRLLLAASLKVTLPYQKILLEEGERIKHLWFPVTAVISLMNVMNNGDAIEITTVGNEGMLGIAGVYGTHAIARAIVQVAGQAYTIPARDFTAVLSQSAGLKAAADAFTYLLLYQIVKTGGCNAMHSVEARCARWLLTMQERRAKDSVPYEMTQEFLADMLGCRRQTVTAIARRFQRGGLIDYRHGIMSLINRPKLEQIACECYHKINRERIRIWSLQHQAA